ncbi:MAG: hypothetical protein HFI49_04940 [Bacilli bacterium]|jgi:hypothetical protein|nr:hypothetical protein [Bacilli bacterium]
MKKNKKTRYFFRTIYILFFIYIALIIAYESGYYETKSHNRAVLTKEAMERFESDLAQGQVIDVKDYLKEEKVDYSNGVTKVGNKISNGISDFMTKGLSGIFDVLKGWFW